MPKNTKATHAIMLQRVNEVYKKQIAGYDRQEILQYGLDEWQLSESMMDKYIARARKYMSQRLKMERDHERGQAAARYDLIFQQALEAEDWAAAIKAQSRLDKILGLEVERREISGPDGSAVVYKLEYPDDE